ncbi:MAG: hypothetical protein ACYCSN_05250 [Acidobacteriaceae bacterium]
MSLTEDFFSAAKQLLLATENLKRLDSKVERLADDVAGMNLRLVRVETMLAIETRPRRSRQLPGERG